MPQLERILCIEDDPDIRTIACFSLEKIGGFTVTTAESGEATMTKIPRFNPQLILLDVMMPGMDGPETLKALRGLSGFADTPVVFMAAKVQPSEVEQFKAMGAMDVVAKPFDPVTLPERIRDLWSSTHERSSRS